MSGALVLGLAAQVFVYRRGKSALKAKPRGMTVENFDFERFQKREAALRARERALRRAEFLRQPAVAQRPAEELPLPFEDMEASHRHIYQSQLARQRGDDDDREAEATIRPEDLKNSRTTPLPETASAYRDEGFKQPSLRVPPPRMRLTRLSAEERAQARKTWAARPSSRAPTRSWQRNQWDTTWVGCHPDQGRRRRYQSQHPKLELPPLPEEDEEFMEEDVERFNEEDVEKEEVSDADADGLSADQNANSEAQAWPVADASSEASAMSLPEQTGSPRPKKPRPSPLSSPKATKPAEVKPSLQLNTKFGSWRQKAGLGTDG